MSAYDDAVSAYRAKQTDWEKAHIHRMVEEGKTSQTFYYLKQGLQDIADDLDALRKIHEEEDGDDSREYDYMEIWSDQRGLEAAGVHRFTAELLAMALKNAPKELVTEIVSGELNTALSYAVKTAFMVAYSYGQALAYQESSLVGYLIDHTRK